MYHQGYHCRCGHHMLAKVLGVLAWVAAVLFFWTSLKEVLVWGFDYDYYAWSVVVLVLISVTFKGCKCCGTVKMGNMCGHDQECKCMDCDKCK